MVASRPASVARARARVTLRIRRSASSRAAGGTASGGHASASARRARRGLAAGWSRKPTKPGATSWQGLSLPRGHPAPPNAGRREEGSPGRPRRGDSASTAGGRRRRSGTRPPFRTETGSAGSHAARGQTAGKLPERVAHTGAAPGRRRSRRWHGRGEEERGRPGRRCRKSIVSASPPAPGRGREGAGRAERRGARGRC